MWRCLPSSRVAPGSRTLPPALLVGSNIWMLPAAALDRGISNFRSFRLLKRCLDARTRAMTQFQSRCVFSGGAVLAEGPVWDERAQQLYWIDIERGRICRFDPASQSNQEWILGTRVGFAVLTEKGDMVAGTQDGLIRFCCQTGKSTPIDNPEPDLPNNRFNDGKCDPAGRLWAGTMSVIETETTGSLYRVDEGGAISKHLSPVTISNGLAWTADSSTMFL